MLRRILVGLVFVLVVGGLVLAEETRGTITKVDDSGITIRTGGFGGKGGKGEGKAEEKTFKVTKDLKITRSVGKDKEGVKLTLDELRIAAKVTNVFVTVTHEGENMSEVKTGGIGAFGGIGKGKGKGKDKDK
jgi:hypothetical protein